MSMISDVMRRAALASLVLCACKDDSSDDSNDDEAGEGLCGPSEGVVAAVVDGDTIDLESGERVRYLMIDTPESTSEVECWGPEAKQANTELVEGKAVSLTYDVECEDDYGRLLAYVSLGDTVVNELMVERGHACVLHVPPNGDALAETYESLAYAAEMLGKGLWAACDPNPCQ